MSFSFLWGLQPENPERQHTSEVANVGDIASIIEGIQSPTIVHVSPPGKSGEILNHSMNVGLGHPARATIEFSTPDGVFYGYEPEVASTSEEIIFMYGADECPYPPDWTRVRPETGARALSEYVQTGERPTCVQWAAA
ncbi:Imm1 family immunity protein [Longispora urticae]